MKFLTFSRLVVIQLALGFMAGGAMAAQPSYRIYVDGLSCPFCAYGVEKKLGEVDGIQSLETNIKNGTVTVTMKDGATLSEDAAERAVNAAGFSLRRLEPVQTTPAEQLK